MKIPEEALQRLWVLSMRNALRSWEMKEPDLSREFFGLSPGRTSAVLGGVVGQILSSRSLLEYFRP